MAENVGRYELVGRIARTGIAEVFLARALGPQRFEKLVVVKRIRSRLGVNPRVVKRFVDETKIAAALDHPNIAHVHELGVHEGTYFQVREYVHGQPLVALQKRVERLGRRCPLEHAVWIGRCVASALHHAHERRGPDGMPLGIVHRDVSQANILVSYDGVVKLVDFGVAKSKTDTDRRVDIQALGKVLAGLAPSSPELERIVARALDPDPNARHKTAEELELELEELARAQQLRQSPIAMRAHIQQLFAAEIISWNEAQLGGLVATDQVTALLAVETVTHDAEVDTLDEQDDDSETREVEHFDETDDYTEVNDPRVAFGDTAHGTIEQPEEPETSAIALPPPPFVAGVIEVSQPPQPYASGQFPVAPMEWRPIQPEPQPEQRMQPLVIVAILIGLFVFAIAITILTA